jgi:hypothetical protein
VRTGLIVFASEVEFRMTEEKARELESKLPDIAESLGLRYGRDTSTHLLVVPYQEPPETWDYGCDVPAISRVFAIFFDAETEPYLDIEELKEQPGWAVAREAFGTEIDARYFPW